MALFTTRWWWISTTIKLALTEADALATSPVVIDIAATGGSGTHSFSEIEAIRDGAVWTDAQLRYSIGGGWLKKTTDTTTAIESANATGVNVTLNAQAIGANMEEVVIDLSYGVMVLTDAQKVALAAAERANMILIDGPKDTITLGRPHELTTGDTVVLPGQWKLHTVDGVTAGQTYYAVVVDAFSFQLANSRNEALAGTPVVDILSHETRIVSQEDIDVAVSGALTATATDFVYLGSERNLAIAAINAGGAVQVKVDGSITDGSADDSAVNITASELLLEAARGSIGGSGGLADLDVTIAAGGLFNGRAEDSIFVTSAGNLAVDTVFCHARTSPCVASADRFSMATNRIMRTSMPSISRSTATVISARRANRLDIDLTTAGRLTAEALGNIHLSELVGDMNIAQVTSTAGDVDLIAAMSILGRPGDFLADVVGNNISLTAIGGSIGAPAGEDLNVDSAKWAPGKLTSQSHFNSYLHETAGDLTINQASSTLGTVFVDSSGRILNGNLTGSNVLSGKTRLYASGDIGEAQNPLKTTVGFLEGKFDQRSGLDTQLRRPDRRRC